MRTYLPLVFLALLPACPDDDGVGPDLDTDAAIAVHFDASRPDAAMDADLQPDAALDAGSSHDARPLPALADAGPGCASWQAEFSHADTHAIVQDGALVLSTASAVSDDPILPGGGIRLHQVGKLSGDFSVTIEVEDLDNAKTFTGVKLEVRSGEAYDDFRAWSALYGSGLHLGYAGSGSSTWSAGLHARNAILSISRVGGNLTLRAVSGEDDVPFQAFTTADLDVSISLLANGDGSPSSARITSFTVEAGGGAVQSDAFDCTSIILP